MAFAVMKETRAAAWICAERVVPSICLSMLRLPLGADWMLVVVPWPGCTFASPRESHNERSA
jgi:hypothetical protein